MHDYPHSILDFLIGFLNSLSIDKYKSTKLCKFNNYSNLEYLSKGLRISNHLSAVH